MKGSIGTAPPLLETLLANEPLRLLPEVRSKPVNPRRIEPGYGGGEAPTEPRFYLRNNLLIALHRPFRERTFALADSSVLQQKSPRSAHLLHFQPIANGKMFAGDTDLDP